MLAASARHGLTQEAAGKHAPSLTTLKERQMVSVPGRDPGGSAIRDTSHFLTDGMWGMVDACGIIFSCC